MRLVFFVTKPTFALILKYISNIYMSTTLGTFNCLRFSEEQVERK